jgi:hypothetical protein
MQKARRSGLSFNAHTEADTHAICMVSVRQSEIQAICLVPLALVTASKRFGSIQD